VDRLGVVALVHDSCLDPEPALAGRVGECQREGCSASLAVSVIHASDRCVTVQTAAWTL
jgi:hypothetical protein